MSDEKALLAAICEHPHDDTPRLVYADWLEETGEPAKVARAEFIRIQCELARVEEDDPRRPRLQKREEQLERRYWKAWAADLPGKRSESPEFQRGFPWPGNVAFSAEALADVRPDQLRGRPIWWLGFNVTAENWRTVLAWPHLDRVYQVKLEGPFPRGWAAAVARCPGLRNVSELSFGRVPVRPADLRVILDAWAGRALATLGLWDYPVGDKVIRVLARHPTAARLRKLDLYRVGLTPAGLRLLASGRGLTGLRELDIHGDPIGDDGLAELLRSPHLHALRKLDLIRTGITDVGAAALADCPGLAGLRKLYLTGN